MAKRNTFTRTAGSTFTCCCCGHRTRNTGVQSIGSETCPDCWELAGIENEISDGYTTVDESRDLISKFLDRIRAKGGDPSIGFKGSFGDLV